MKAVFLDYATMGADLDLGALRALFSDLELFDDTDDDEIIERARDVDVVFTNKIKLTESLLANLPRLRFIGLTATGTDNIDLQAAAKHGIAVANIRAYCTQSVVEHVFGVLLMLTHSIEGYQRSVRSGDWQKSTQACLLNHPIREVSAMTMGIVGYGALGQGVAAMAQAFGMPVIVAARPGATEVPTGRVGFDEFLARADVISLHCPLNDATRALFGPAAFTRMKRGSILINTARGGLVDSAALVAALDSGHLYGAAIDVLANEPPIAGDPLLDSIGDKLIVTPHIAWGTDRARQNAIDELAANSAAFLAGTARNRVV